MEGLPSVTPKLMVEVLNRLENDVDNLFSWKLTQSQDSFSLTVSCKLRTKLPTKPRTTAGSPDVLLRRNQLGDVVGRRIDLPLRWLVLGRDTRGSWKKKLAGKPDLALPGKNQQDSDNSVCV